MGPILPVEIQPWYEKAACLDKDADCFFPEKGGSTRAAKRICQTCSVQAECLDYALENDERFGIWGGLSERERRRLKRRASWRPTAGAPRGSSVVVSCSPEETLPSTKTP